MKKIFQSWYKSLNVSDRENSVDVAIEFGEMTGIGFFYFFIPFLIFFPETKNFSFKFKCQLS